MTEPYTVTVLTDYGPLSDMAFAEVSQNIYDRMKGLNVRLREYSVPAFDTVQTGFMLAQTALNSQLGDRHFFFVNTAPRHDDDKPRADSAGEGLVYVRLFNGVRIVAVNSGYSLSFLKGAMEQVSIVNVSNKGSQFRSRDFYPQILGEIANGDESNITGQEASVPDVPDGYLCFAPGSSGWTLPDGTRRRFAEIVRRSGNAFKDFAKPKGGTPVKFKPLS